MFINVLIRLISSNMKTLRGCWLSVYLYNSIIHLRKNFILYFFITNIHFAKIKLHIWYLFQSQSQFRNSNWFKHYKVFHSSSTDFIDAQINMFNLISKFLHLHIILLPNCYLTHNVTVEIRNTISYYVCRKFFGWV